MDKNLGESRYMVFGDTKTGKGMHIPVVKGHQHKNGSNLSFQTGAKKVH